MFNSTPEELAEQHPSWDDYTFGKLCRLVERLPSTVKESALKIAAAAGRPGKMTLHGAHSAIKVCLGVWGLGFGVWGLVKMTLHGARTAIKVCFGFGVWGR